jgi:hypothetical protein
MTDIKLQLIINSLDDIKKIDLEHWYNQLMETPGQNNKKEFVQLSISFSRRRDYSLMPNS